MIEIGIFAKPPQAGKVKTRLIPDIGAEAATAVYRHCLRHALDTVATAQMAHRVFLSEPSDDPVFSGFRITLQRGDDLGQRMYNAITDLLDAGAAGAILIGTDCMDLCSGHLQAAARALTDHDLVLLPALDGGYALIGCRRIAPELFTDVQWSSAGVRTRTLANAENMNYRIEQLETVRDIDTLQDLEHYPELAALVTPQ